MFESAGIIDINRLLRELSPKLHNETYVFVSLPSVPEGGVESNQVFSIISEDEGKTLILTRAEANRRTLPYQGEFSRITLLVHSALHAVGLTAAVSTRLAEERIPANIVAGYYHDHVFVPSDRAGDAMAALDLLRGNR